MRGYLDVMAHPVSRALFSASSISLLGDWIGFGALIVLVFERSGSAVGPAALFAVQGIATALATTLLGPHLDRVDRRTGIMAAYSLGGVGLVGPLLFSGVWPAYLAVALLGILRPLAAALRHATAAIELSPGLLGRTMTLEGAIGQGLVAVGLASGGAIAVGLSSETALGLDIATFLTAAFLARAIPHGRGVEEARRRGDNDRSWLANAQVRRMLLLLLASAAVGAIPESLAPLAAPNGPWLPVVLASQAAGTGLGSFLLGHDRSYEQPGGLMALVLASAVTLVGCAVVFDLHPAALAVANLLFGLGLTFSITARVAFARVVPANRLGAATAAAITATLLAEAAGSLGLATLAAHLSPSVAYLAAAGIMLAAGAAVLAIRDDATPVAIG